MWWWTIILIILLLLSVVGIASSAVIASGALGDDFHQQMMDQIKVQEGYDKKVLVNSIFLVVVSSLLIHGARMGRPDYLMSLIVVCVIDIVQDDCR